VKPQDEIWTDGRRLSLDERGRRLRHHALHGALVGLLRGAVPAVDGSVRRRPCELDIMRMHVSGV
jgi:hypothetical protein